MIICLRPQPDCDSDVAELNRRAAQAVALPMLQVIYVPTPPTQLSNTNHLAIYQGVIITSKQASRYLSEQILITPDLRHPAVWCVGSGSADILKQAGCQIAYSGKGNAADLADQICGQGDGGPFLWLSGQDVHLDIATSLKSQGITVDREIIYHTEGLRLPHQVIQEHLLSRQDVAVIVYSARTLKQFEEWLAEYAPTANRAQLTVLAASAGLAEHARALGYPALQASSAERQALLHLSVDWYQQNFKNRSQKLT
jgi:uroporphyrinogen-III synthase